MKKLFVIVAIIFGAFIGRASGTNAAGDTLTLAVYGDWPYSATLLSEAPLLISSINSDPDVGLVLHVGDIHSGSMPCSAAWNKGIFDLFQQFQDPLVYTPGDNEWADCQKPKESSSGYPLTELANIRALFFANPGHTLGMHPKRVLSQADVFRALSRNVKEWVTLCGIDRERVYKDSGLAGVSGLPA